MRSAVRGATIRIFLIDGTPQGMRVVDKSGWTGSCLDFARPDFAEARRREELSRTGVYVLVGPDPATSEGRQRIYVGEADVVRTRLDGHQKEKEFWTRAYVFTTKDDSLNKAHVRYLEARLVGLARRAGLAALDNGTVPEPRGLSEAERAEMEAYLDEALLVLPLIGVEAFDPVTVDTPAPTVPPAAPTRSESITEPAEPVSSTRYFMRERGRGPTGVTVEAEGRDSPRGFIVLEGARGPDRDRVMSGGYAALRGRLRDEGVLVSAGGEQVRLTRNYVFDSPSAAATIMAGSNRPGTTAWKDDKGRTLAERRSGLVP